MSIDEPQENIYKFIKKSNYDNKQINLPISSEYFNYENNRIHMRSFWPVKNLKSIVFFIHGYASNINRPIHRYISEEMIKNDIAYIGVDLPGHGYSNGERALIISHFELLKIILKVIDITFSDIISTDTYNINRPFNKINKDIPIFLFGHSMGGSLAILSSLEIKKSYNLKGLILACPAIKVNTPPQLLRYIMTDIITPLFPYNQIPDWLVNNPGKYSTWKSDDYIKYINNDKYPQNPNGLSWGGTMKFQSGTNLLTLIESTFQLCQYVSSPFILFHDPEDKTSLFEGTEFFMEKSKELLDEQKELVILKYSSHDLLTNQLGFITKRIFEWIDKQLS